MNLIELQEWVTRFKDEIDGTDREMLDEIGEALVEAANLQLLKDHLNTTEKRYKSMEAEVRDLERWHRQDRKKIYHLKRQVETWKGRYGTARKALVDTLTTWKRREE